MPDLFKQTFKAAGKWQPIFISVNLLLISILLMACAPQTKLDVSTQPAWVVGVSEKYPATQYFVGKGRSSALDVAAKNARTSLTKTLSELSSSEASAALGKLSENAEVVDAWYDKTGQEHYALVVIERSAAIELLRQQLSELNDKTQQYIRSATQRDDPLLQIRATHEALATQPQRAELRLALKTLGDDAEADASVWSVTELQVHLKSLLSSIDVRPLASDNRQLGSAIARGLDAAGYLSKRSEPSFELKTTLQRSGMKWEQGRFTEHGTLFVELLDSNKQVRAKAQWPLTAQSHERTMLEKELMGMVESTLGTEFGDTVMGFVTKAAGD